MNVQAFTYPATRPQKGPTVSRSGSWVAVCRYCFLGVALVLGLTVAGCATANIGNQNLTARRIAQIKKGITTEAEVIRLLGPPDNITLLPDGRRMMYYSGMQTKTNSNGAAVVAVSTLTFGLGEVLMPSDTSQTEQQQTLQIILTKNDIVQDYEYSNNASNTKSTVSVFGSHTEESAMPPTTTR